MKFSFEKFVKDIVKKEETLEPHVPEIQKEETAQRRYNRLYREKWQNSMRFRRVKR